jgi:glycosyltransferase involved in cell wall biosynthesis
MRSLHDKGEMVLTSQRESGGVQNRRGYSSLFRLQKALQNTGLLTGLFRITDKARLEANHPDGTRHSGLTRVAAQSLGKTWLVIRHAIPEDFRRRLHEWLLEMASPKPTHRPAGEPRFPGLREAELGINIIGYISSESGLGEAARSSARAAQASAIPVDLLDFSHVSPARMREHVPGDLSLQARYPVNLFQLNALEMLTQSRLRPLLHEPEAYNIGVWFWETSELPDAWLKGMDYLDEIWAASSFCLDVFSRKSSVPVVRIPVCVEPTPPADLSREALGLPEKGFLFLAMADFFSGPERKNPSGVLEAYRRAFDSSAKDVFLVLKLNNSSHEPEVREVLDKWIRADSRIILIDGYLDRPELNALINQCDCMVSLHRSEGFGLPLAEAMYMGKPAIATGWSGNMDFMTAENSLPVRYRLIPVNQDSGPYKGSKGFWADPDTDHAARQMKILVSDESLRRELGRAARFTIRKHFSAQTVGRIMRERLNFIRDHIW